MSGGKEVELLIQLWTEIIIELHGDYVPPFNGKQRKQLQTFDAACPPEQAAFTLETCMRCWDYFALKAKAEAGAFGIPQKPTLDFLLKHVAVAANYAIGKQKPEVVENVALTFKSSPAVPEPKTAPQASIKVSSKTFGTIWQRAVHLYHPNAEWVKTCPDPANLKTDCLSPLIAELAGNQADAEGDMIVNNVISHVLRCCDDYVNRSGGTGDFLFEFPHPKMLLRDFDAAARFWEETDRPAYDATGAPIPTASAEGCG